MFKKLMIYVFLLFAFVGISANRISAEDDSENRTYYVSYTVMAHVSFINGNIEFSQDVIPGEPMNEPSHIQVEGYEFIGWFYNDVKWNFADPVREHMSLTARYKEIKDTPSDSSEDSSSGSVVLPKTGINVEQKAPASINTGEGVPASTIYSLLWLLALLLIVVIMLPDKYLEDSNL